jgi:hypothetical protein
MQSNHSKEKDKTTHCYPYSGSQRKSQTTHHGRKELILLTEAMTVYVEKFISVNRSNKLGLIKCC